MPKVSLTYENGVQKGPATDYSMLLEMKRRSAISAGQNWKSPAGNQNTKPFIRELHLASGTGTGATEYYRMPAIRLGFLKF